MNRLRWWPRSLRFKFIAASLAIQLITLVMLTWAGLSTTSDAMLKQAHRQLHALTPILNTSLADPVFEEDLAVLQERANRIIDGYRFRYLLITDAFGDKVLEHGEPSDQQQPLPARHIDMDESLAHMNSAVSTLPLKIADFTVGHATIHIDARPIEQTLSKLRELGIGIAGIAVLVTLALLTLTGGLLTDGLVGLTRASRRLADGDLSSRVEVYGSDELAELGQAFNAMAASLATQQGHLRQQGERIRLLMDSTAEAICGVDEDGLCTFANRACLAMLGFDEESDILGVNLTGLLRLPDEYARRQAQGLPCHSDDLRIATSDDKVLDLECWSHPIVLEGRVSGAVITILDISDRRRAESLLRESEGRYRLLVENQTDLVVKVDRDGHFLFVSPGYCETFGISADQLLGRSFMPLVHEADRAATAEAMQQLYRPPYECVLEQRAKTVHGWRWFSWADKAVRDEHGEVVGIVGVGRDITDRKLAEQALQASEVRLRAVVDNSPALILMKDLAGRVTVMSQQHGPAATADPSDPVIEAMSKAMDHYNAAAVQADGRVAGDAEREIAIEHNDGSRQAYSVVTFALIAEDAKPLGTGAMALDVTEQRRMQDALRESEERFNLAVTGSSDGIWDWNLDTDEIYFSDRFKELLGYQAHELDSVWENWRDWVHDQDIAMVSEAIDDHLVTNTPCSFECRLRSKSGDFRWFLVRGQAVRNSNGQAVRMAGSLTDVTYRRETEARIKHLAYYDELTGLPNRRLMMEELQRRITALRSKSKLGAVVILDLDHFKKINDSLGHHYGDVLLRLVGERLRGEVRSDDMVGRLGGDEFVILLSDLGNDERSAQLRARRVTDKLKQVLKAPYDLDGHRWHVTPSMGVILFPDGIETVEDVLKRADTALYASKNDGRDTVRFYQPEMQAAIDSRLTIEKDLRLAIERNQLDLHFQPQFGQGGAQLLGAEALLRWRHPDHGWVSPAEFIPVAEDTGLIIPIGRWVLTTVVQKIEGWVASGMLGSGLSISVNLSARQFYEHSVVNEIAHLLRRHNVAGAWLKLELTESILMHDIKAAIGKVEQLKRLGIGFALDDFGTGYSSLSYLKALPFDELKIDRSFVRDIPNDANDVAITETIIAMAHHLGLKVVAEGVETADQLALLKEKGCTSYQGYYFSRPLPGDAFEHLLQANANGSRDNDALMQALQDAAVKR